MKNITGKTLIFYTFQNRKEKQHNVTTFKKSAPSQPKIRDVLYQLPLDYNKNSYHFRFKSEFFEGDEKIIGWIDISNLLAKVPIINNTIFVKVLTIPNDNANKLFNRDKLLAIGLIDPKAGSKNVSEPLPQKITKNTNNSNGAVPKNVIKTSVKRDNEDLLAGMKDIQKPVVPKQEQKVEVKKTESNNKGDLFQMGPVENGNVKKLVPQETTEQRLKGFKDNCDAQAQERQNQIIAEKQFEQRLLQWGYSGHKTINNLTTLLATLHQIWPQWQPVSLTSMLNQDDVNALFKKAVVKVHPDKNRRKDFKTKYLAKRVFQLLNQAKKAQQQN